MRKLKRQSLELKQQVIAKLLKHRLTSQEAADLLGCQRLTVYRYSIKAIKSGLDALKDGRHSNNHKLTSKQLLGVIQEKKAGH